MSRARVSIAIEAAGIDFSEQDILDLVGPEMVDRKRSESPGGVFKAWVVCNETVARPKMKSTGRATPIEFGRDAVRSAYDKLKQGLKFFWKHDNSNSPARQPVGEVVGKTTREIEGNLHTIAVGWFPPEERERADRSDAISMESIWNLVEDSGRLIAESVEEMTGIALFSRADGMRPGFDGASELATIHAYNEEIESMAHENGTAATLEADNELDDFRAFKSAARKMSILPTQVWSPQTIVGRRIQTQDGSIEYVDGDRGVSEYIERYVVDPIRKHYEQQMAELKNELAEVRRKAAMADAPVKLEQFAQEAGYPDRVLKLARARLDTIQPGEDADQSLREFLAAQAKEDERLREIYGQPATEPAQNDQQPALGATAPASDDKESNPFLPPEER